MERAVIVGFAILAGISAALGMAAAFAPALLRNIGALFGGRGMRLDQGDRVALTVLAAFAGMWIGQHVIRWIGWG